MTVEEKIGQLSQVGGISLSADAPKPEEEVRKGKAGSVLWVADPAAINKLQQKIPTISPKSAASPEVIIRP